MFQLVIPEKEIYIEELNEFLNVKKTVINLEHSLISVRKWEAKHRVPFLDKKEKNYDEIVDYIRCMTLDRNVDPMIYLFIPTEEYEKIIAYIKEPMTATWFNELSLPEVRGRKEIVTAEIIYYWMVTMNIPVEFERWHLNQLLTLIKVINYKNAPKKKISKRDRMKAEQRINAARREKYNTKG